MNRGVGLQIEYKNRGLEKVCTIAHEAEKKHGKDMAILIHRRIDQIKAADSVETLAQYRIGGCHMLKGNRKNQYSMTLVQPYRLIFEKKDSDIQIIRIIEITDYH